MDHTPRRLWRLVIQGDAESVFASRTFALCSSCYYCTLRCPRQLPLTEAMAALKRIAHQNREPAQAESQLFYRQFLAGVRRRGRVNESEFMTYYFLALKNPVVPFQYAPLGMKLFCKGKIAPPAPWPWRKDDRLEPIFRKVAAMEEGR
jgi:heterodisulfide reductase subunit C